MRQTGGPRTVSGYSSMKQPLRCYLHTAPMPPRTGISAFFRIAHDVSNAHRARALGPYAKRRAKACSTQGGTSSSTEPLNEAISRTIELDRYMYCGGDMMNMVSISLFRR